MKLFKKMTVLFTICMMLSCLIMPIQAEAASINKTKATVYVGDTVKLKLTGTSKKKTWSSNNKNVATVSSSGVVKAKKAGTATITVKFGTSSKKCKITVKKAPTLSAKKVTLNVNGTKKLTVNRPIGTVKWSTSNKNVATVSKGKITAKKAGKATITAKVNGRTLKCAVTVKNADAEATELTFTTSDGGDFIQDTAMGSIKFKLSAASTDVKVQILDASDEVVFTEKIASCKKNKTCKTEWDGMDNNGDYVDGGSYRVRITAGTVKSYSDFLQVYEECPFDAGTGSASNPYQVRTLEHLKKVVEFSSRKFIQVDDIDGDLEQITPLCSKDAPFTGEYDGNDYLISNIRFNEVGHATLFVASAGKITDVCMENIYATCTDKNGRYVSALVGLNTGTIKNCNISDCVISGELENMCGGVAGRNEGTIVGCVVKDTTVSGTPYSNWDPAMGGVAGINGGSIIDCTADSVSVSGWKAGGITGMNTSSGQCVNCKTIGKCSIVSDHYPGAIVGFNDGGAIVNCSTTTSYNLSGYN